MSLSRPRSGFSLVELLIVLVILTILTTAGVSFFSPRTPRATRAAVTSLRNAVQSARQAAVSSGKTVRIKLVNTAGKWLFQVYDTTLAETVPAALLSSESLDPSSLRYCSILTSTTGLADNGAALQGVVTAIAYGFGSAASWANPLAGSTTYGFAPDGTAVSLAGASPNPAVSSLGSGFWVGALGETASTQGIPYGAVMVTQQGQVVTLFYTAANSNANLNWIRLE